MAVQTLETVGLDLVRAGYEPIPIVPGEKMPDVLNWSMISVDEERITGWCDRMRGQNYVGLRCGAIIGVDIDIDNEEVTRALLGDAQFTLGDGPERYGKPGRALLMLRADKRWKKKRIELTDSDGGTHAIEVLAHGQQFVAYGQHHSGRPYTWQNGSPLETPLESLPVVTEAEVVDWLLNVADLLPAGWTVTGIDARDDDEQFLLNYRPERSEDEMTPDEVIEQRALIGIDAWVLDAFPGAREYQEGYRVSSKSLGRDLEEDLQIFPSGIYDFGEERGFSAAGLIARWVTDGDMTAARAWLAERLNFDADAHAEVVETKREEERPGTVWKTRIEEAGSVDRLQKLADAIARNRTLTRIDRELLANAMQKRLNTVADAKVSIAEVRKSLAPARNHVDSGGDSMPEWCRGWYYITHTDQFFRYGSTQWVSTQGFNALFQRELPPDEDGRRPSANRFALDDAKLPVAENGIYAPHLDETFTLGGRRCVNTFIPDSVPPTPVLPPDEAGRAAINRVDQHLLNLCGHRNEVYAHLKAWLAFTVQNPGMKIRHTPIIKGIEGDGKTTLLVLMAICLGDANVRSIAPQVVVSQFNGYAEGRIVVGIEELRMTGHNRHDAMNALKQLITNDTIDVHKKGQDSYNTINVTNYIAFTNHQDAVPLSDTDRRWFVVFTPWANKVQMEAFIGSDAKSYFDALYDALDNHGDAIRYWLHNETSCEGFDRHGAAPMTPEKVTMAEADMDDADEVLRELLKTGGKGYSSRVLSTAHLSAAMLADEFDGPVGFEAPKGRTLAKMLQKLGWTRYPHVMKWHGKSCRVWTHGTGLDSNEAIRAALDATTFEVDPDAPASSQADWSDEDIIF